MVQCFSFFILVIGRTVKATNLGVCLKMFAIFQTQHQLPHDYSECYFLLIFSSKWIKLMAACLWKFGFGYLLMLLTSHELLQKRKPVQRFSFPHPTQVLDIWMMSPWLVLVLGQGSLQLGWRPAPVLWDTEGSSVRCASRATEEKPRVSGHIAHVCFVPAMDTVRPVTLRQVSRCSLGAACPKFSSADG